MIAHEFSHLWIMWQRAGLRWRPKVQISAKRNASSEDLLPPFWTWIKNRTRNSLILPTKSAQTAGSRKFRMMAAMRNPFV